LLGEVRRSREKLHAHECKEIQNNIPSFFSITQEITFSSRNLRLVAQSFAENHRHVLREHLNQYGFLFGDHLLIWIDEIA